MIIKSKEENAWGSSYDHSYYDTDNGSHCEIIKVYGYDCFVGGYTSGGTWRVDFNGKSVYWGDSFQESSSHALKLLKENNTSLKVGDYVMYSDSYLKKWSESEGSRCSDICESYKNNTSCGACLDSEKKRVLRIETITREEVCSRQVISTPGGAVRKGSLHIQLTESDFKKINNWKEQLPSLIELYRECYEGGL